MKEVKDRSLFQEIMTATDILFTKGKLYMKTYILNMISCLIKSENFVLEFGRLYRLIVFFSRKKLIRTQYHKSVGFQNKKN